MSPLDERMVWYTQVFSAFLGAVPLTAAQALMVVVLHKPTEKKDARNYGGGDCPCACHDSCRMRRHILFSDRYRRAGAKLDRLAINGR